MGNSSALARAMRFSMAARAGSTGAAGAVAAGAGAGSDPPQATVNTPNTPNTKTAADLAARDTTRRFGMARSSARPPVARVPGVYTRV